MQHGNTESQNATRVSQRVLYVRPTGLTDSIHAPHWPHRLQGGGTHPEGEPSEVPGLVHGVRRDGPRRNLGEFGDQARRRQRDVRDRERVPRADVWAAAALSGIEVVGDISTFMNPGKYIFRLIKIREGHLLSWSLVSISMRIAVRVASASNRPKVSSYNSLSQNLQQTAPAKGYPPILRF